jgi:hypothetical protein
MRRRIGRRKTFPDLDQFLKAGEVLNQILAELDARIDQTDDPEELKLIATLAAKVDSLATRRRIRAEECANRLLGYG